MVGFLAAALAETGVPVPVLTDRVLLTVEAVVDVGPFCAAGRDGLCDGEEPAGLVDCLRAVVVPGTGGFLAVVDDMTVCFDDSADGKSRCLDHCCHGCRLSDAYAVYTGGCVCWWAWLRIGKNNNYVEGFGEAVQ